MHQARIACLGHTHKYVTLNNSWLNDRQMHFLICFSFHIYFLPFSDTLIILTSLLGKRKKKYTLPVFTCLLWFSPPWIAWISITNQDNALFCMSGLVQIFFTQLQQSIELQHWVNMLKLPMQFHVRHLKMPKNCLGKCAVARTSLSLSLSW